MYFYQNAAPTGWTLDSGVTDKVLAVKGGSNAYDVNGGNTAGTWTQPNHTHTTASHTLTVSEMPAHKHKVYNGETANSTYSNGGHAGTITLRTQDYTYTQQVGGGNAHSHGNTGNGATANSWRPNGAVGIIATKD
jgi:hypothetical protein